MNFLNRLKKSGEIQDFPAHSNVFSEGDAADFLYVIISGELELTLGDDLLSTESEGGIIGEMAILESAQQGATAATLTDVKAVKFDHDLLKTLLTQNTEFSLQVMGVLASRLRLVDEYNSTDFNQ